MINIWRRSSAFITDLKKQLNHFVAMAAKLGFNEAEAKEAFAIAFKKQKECFNKFSELGKIAIDNARMTKRPVIAVLGRPYNSFTPDANMGIPRNIHPGLFGYPVRYPSF